MFPIKALKAAFDYSTVYKYRTDNVKMKYESFYAKAHESVAILSSIKDTLFLLTEHLPFNTKREECNVSYNKICSGISALKKKLKILKILGQNEYDELAAFEKTLLFEIKVLQHSVRPSPCDKNLSGEGSKMVCNKPSSRSNSKKISEKPMTIGQFNHNFHPNDHTLFLKIYNKYSSPKREVLLCKFLSHITTDKMIEHCEKYKIYLNKVQLTKFNIESWKSLKNDKSVINNDAFVNYDNSEQNSESKNGSVSTNKRKSVNDCKLRFKELQEWKEKRKQEQMNKPLGVMSMPGTISKLVHNKCQYSKQERDEIKLKIEVHKSKKLEQQSNKHSTTLKCKKNLEHYSSEMTSLKEKDKAFMNLRLSRINAKQINKSTFGYEASSVKSNSIEGWRPFPVQHIVRT